MILPDPPLLDRLAARGMRAMERALGRHRLAAMRLFGRLLASHRAPLLALDAMRGELARARGDNATAEGYWQRLTTAMPLDARWPLALAQAANTRADYAGAERIVQDALDRGVRDTELTAIGEHYGRWLRRSNSAVAEAVELLQGDAAGHPMRAMQAAIFLSSEGEIDLARAGLQPLLSHRRIRDQARAQLVALDLLERADAVRSIPGWLSPARPFALVEAAGSDTLVIGFMPPGGLYGVPVNVLHAMLVPAGVNALYLYDSRGLYHLQGTDRFAGGYRAMIDGIRLEAQRLGVRKLATIGFSAAGYTALRAGLDLEADGVLGFSAVTSFAPEDMRTDGRLPGQRERLLVEIPDHTIDLRPEIEARTSCAAISLHYDANSPQYAAHARHLAGVDGVTLHPIEGEQATDAIGRLVLSGQHHAAAEFIARL